MVRLPTRRSGRQFHLRQGSPVINTIVKDLEKNGPQGPGSVVRRNFMSKPQAQSKAKDFDSDQELDSDAVLKDWGPIVENWSSADAPGNRVISVNEGVPEWSPPPLPPGDKLTCRFTSVIYNQTYGIKDMPRELFVFTPSPEPESKDLDAELSEEKSDTVTDSSSELSEGEKPYLNSSSELSEEEKPKSDSSSELSEEENEKPKSDSSSELSEEDEAEKKDHSKPGVDLHSSEYSSELSDEENEAHAQGSVPGFVEGLHLPQSSNSESSDTDEDEEESSDYDEVFQSRYISEESSSDVDDEDRDEDSDDDDASSAFPFEYPSEE